ncbi:hypothetical protein Bca52824_007062 [Brassica carinata]|uniref:Uncharacterized protein n=1 Tax=Brassica carinata TaxID=52824 RepID=A0A8X7W764_BRACI|nr:hypothetical protein Bca52824_007062 [Brassica carinata]
MARLLFRLLQEATSPSPPDVSPTLNSDLIVIIAALLCALICVLGLLAVSRCTWLWRIATSNSGQTHQPPVAAANKGLKKKVLRSLPKLTYSPDSPPADKLADCAICLTEFSAGDELRVLPQCQKCGGLPGSSGSGSEPDTGIKQREDAPDNFLP